MDSHPKKKEKRKTSTEQIRNQSTVTSFAEKTKYSPYKAKTNQTPLPNTAIQICLSKKKKKPIQRKPNPRPRANQTHGETSTVTSLAGAARFVARRPCLLVVDSLLVRPSSSLAARASSQIVVDCRSVLGYSGARRSASRYLSLSLSLSFSLSLSEMKNM